MYLGIIIRNYNHITAYSSLIHKYHACREEITNLNAVVLESKEKHRISVEHNAISQQKCSQLERVIFFFVIIDYSVFTVDWSLLASCYFELLNISSKCMLFLLRNHV